MIQRCTHVLHRCMAFERFNQSFKRMAEICNFRDVAKSMATFWSMSSAVELANKCAASWGVDVINISGEYSDPNEVESLISSDTFFRQASEKFGGKVVCVRELASRTRGSATIGVHEWVLACDSKGKDHLMFVQRICHMQDVGEAHVFVCALQFNVSIQLSCGDAGIVRVPVSQYHEKNFTEVVLEESLMCWSELHLAVVDDTMLFRGII